MSAQHRYAKLVSTGQAVDIRKVGKSDGPFKCIDPKCDQEMIAHKGDILTHHFSHKPRPDGKSSDCKLVGHTGGSGESSTHIYFKRYLSGCVRNITFARKCVGCGRETRKHRFPSNCRAVLEHPITIQERKYVLDVAILDGRDSKVIGALEVRHYHALPAQKITDLQTEFGLSVHELSTQDLETHESNPTINVPDLLADRREWCTVCKGGDVVAMGGGDESVPVQVDCKQKNPNSSSSRSFFKKASEAMKPDRKCHSCNAWVHHTAVTSVACERYEYKPGKFSMQRFVCGHCHLKCPSCKVTVLDRQYIAEKSQCVLCYAESKRIAKCVEKKSDLVSLEQCLASKLFSRSDFHAALKEKVQDAIKAHIIVQQQQEKSSIRACFAKQSQKAAASTSSSSSSSSVSTSAPPPSAPATPHNSPAQKPAQPAYSITKYFLPLTPKQQQKHKS